MSNDDKSIEVAGVNVFLLMWLGLGVGGVISRVVM